MTQSDIISLAVTSISMFISIIVAVVVVHYSERTSFKSKIGKRKEPRDQATCALHILQSLNNAVGNQDTPGNLQPNSTLSWMALAQDATARISKVTEGGNYEMPPEYLPNKRPRTVDIREKDRNTHAHHMLDACEHLIDKDLVIESDINGESHFRITLLGNRVVRRVGQYASVDERDALFEDYYQNNRFPLPHPGMEHGRHHREFLNELLPLGRKGEIVIRADNGFSIIFLFRFQIKTRGSSERSRSYLEWSTLQLSHDMDTFSFAPAQLQLAEVRQIVDKAWNVEDIADHKKFNSTIDDEVFTYVSYFREEAWARLDREVKESWPGQTASPERNYNVLEELGVEDSEYYAETIPVIDDIECVAWVALVPETIGVDYSDSSPRVYSSADSRGNTQEDSSVRLYLDPSLRALET